jgi:hypothetical protein
LVEIQAMLEFTAPALWRLKELAKRRRFFGLAVISSRFRERRLGP